MSASDGLRGPPAAADLATPAVPGARPASRPTRPTSTLRLPLHLSFAERSLWQAPPIENAFAKLKALLRKGGEPTLEGLWTVIGRLLDAFTPSECTISPPQVTTQREQIPL